MRTVVDDSLMSRRRTIELAGLVSRSIGIASTAFYGSGLSPYSPAGLDAGVTLACWLGVAVMSLSNVLGLLARRRPGSRWYPWLSATQVTLDTATITGVVLISTLHYPQVTTWPLLMLTVTIGALRHRLAGALLVCLLTSAAFMAGVPGTTDDVFVVGINLMIAVITGTQSSAFAKQLTTLQETRRELQHQANHDPLTGLPNRSQLACWAADRTGSPLAVLLLDLNGFKKVNDTYGHAAGDVLLHEIGARLGAVLEPGDLAGRLGGDEFLVLLPDADSARSARTIARIRDAVSRPIAIGNGREVTVGVSVGFALRAAGSDVTLDTLTAEADAAMYRDKRKLAA
ncbi:diguanylate cyclase [Actinoplanes sp. NPDC023714]|uniref:diguanylate cyclase domain-containing protein n=1 Tax=Actinoplanes sp. NPDC023714 TaxID=3154322 RepID=UPI0033EB85C8